MNLVRGRIGNYFKYIGTMNSFFYSIEFYWTLTGDQILWRFRIYQNNLRPCPEGLWVITPNVSYVIPIRVAVHMLHVFTKVDSCTWHFLFTPFAVLGIREMTKMNNVRWDTCLPPNRLCFITEVYPLWTTNLTWELGNTVTPAVKFELDLEVHLPFYFSSFVSVLIPK